MRDELQRMLASKLPERTIEFDKTLVSLDSVAGRDGAGGSGARCTFADGTSAEFDLVVGCDGIGSQVRRTIVGTGAEPSRQYSNIRITFGVAPAGQRPEGSENEMHQWFGDGAYALTGTYGGLEGEHWACKCDIFTHALFEALKYMNTTLLTRDMVANLATISQR